MQAHTSEFTTLEHDGDDNELLLFFDLLLLWLQIEQQEFLQEEK